MRIVLCPQCKQSVDLDSDEAIINWGYHDKCLDDSLRDYYLDKLETLGDDWDGMGAAVPTKEAIERAKNTAKTLLIQHDLAPDSFEPDATGGIAVWYFADVDQFKGAMLSFPNRGGCYLCFDNQLTPSPPECKTFSLEDSVLIARLKDYLLHAH